MESRMIVVTCTDVASTETYGNYCCEFTPSDHSYVNQGTQLFIIDDKPIKIGFAVSMQEAREMLGKQFVIEVRPLAMEPKSVSPADEAGVG